MSPAVLVIEDHADNLSLVRYILEAFGYCVLAATDGERGIELARAERPDLIICDLALPGIDGFEVLRRLRAELEPPQPPVFAVTAFAMVGDRERVLAAGFNGYLAKPIEPESFARAVAEQLAVVPPTQRGWS